MKKVEKPIEKKKAVIKKPEVKPEPKQLSVDEQISQIYDEIHKDTEDERPAQGFIGQHLQKLRLAEKAK